MIVKGISDILRKTGCDSVRSGLEQDI